MMATTPTPELIRLASGIELLDALRVVFAQMECDGERDRAWTYLSSRFSEFEGVDMPAWEEVA